VYVFIDESGDAGISGAAGSSSCFVIVMVVFSSSHEVENCVSQLAELKTFLDRSHRSEFKFAKMRLETKLAFAQALSICQMVVVAAVINKSQLTSGYELRSEKNFYNHVLGMLFELGGPHLNNSKVKIDGKSRKYAGPRLHNLPPGKIAKLRFSDSTSDLLIQVADFFAGAIRRSLSSDGDQKRSNELLIGTALRSGKLESHDLTHRLNEKRPDS
jgi:hypothetical protein